MPIWTPTYGHYLPSTAVQKIEELAGKSVHLLTKSEIDNYLSFIYGVEP